MALLQVNLQKGSLEFIATNTESSFLLLVFMLMLSNNSVEKEKLKANVMEKFKMKYLGKATLASMV
jgi:hypothetical protein